MIPLTLHIKGRQQLTNRQGRSIVNGNASEMADQEAGAPSKRWTEEIANDGLLRYYLMLNLERILVTTPKALSEVLVHKAYDFEKPKRATFFLSMIIGYGLVLAEGDAHKVWAWLLW